MLYPEVRTAGRGCGATETSDDGRLFGWWLVDRATGLEALSPVAFGPIRMLGVDMTQVVPRRPSPAGRRHARVPALFRSSNARSSRATIDSSALRSHTRGS